MFSNGYDKVRGFFKELTNGKGFEKVFLGGVNPLPENCKTFNSSEEIFKSMKKKNIPAALVYGYDGDLKFILLNINKEYFRLHICTDGSGKIDSISIVDSNNTVLNPRVTPLKGLKKAGLIEYFEGYLFVDDRLYTNIHSSDSFKITTASYKEEELPSFDLAEYDQEDIEDELSLLTEEYPVIPIYKRGKFVYAMARFEYMDNKPVYHKVYLEDEGNGRKKLKSDIDLYYKFVARAIKYNELISFLLRHEKTEDTPKTSLVKGFEK